uniref:Mariner Mos1 transposase n=1 Tax=Pseudonaja textilis TaxID=8673 RepID=A0A670YLX0_PSETE
MELAWLSLVCASATQSASSRASGKFIWLLVISQQTFQMCAAIENPASCEVQSFKNGRTNVHDEQRIDDKIRENHRFTVTELSLSFPQISRSLLHEIVTQKLGYHKFGARWVPKILTENHKNQRMAASLTFLETKLQKIMASVFGDRQGVLLIDFLEHGATINSVRYCETLQKVRKAIQNKRRGKLSSEILFLHDNARPHTANPTREVLNAFKWEIFPHPPYSPDLAPSDYHLFLRIKTWLGTQRFDDNAELRAGVTDWLKSQEAEFYDNGITKLVHRYDKCLNLFSEYVEK